MPRKLPWSTGENRRNSSPISSVKKQPASRSVTATESDDASTPSRAPTTKIRSSSASPPREPPPEEYMMDGLEHDDIYVMVEDEFLATAQAFTRHLHHAEYQRRKQQARIENADAIRKLSRPTDPKAALRADTVKNIESDRARKRHNSALDELREGAGRPFVDSELEEVDSDEEDKEDDPWVGTSLHALMTSPSKSRSLVGLQEIKSTTRAALGFSKAVSSSSRQDAVGRGCKGLSPGSNLPSGRVEEDAEEPEEAVTVTEDDDDLNAPSRLPEGTPQQRDNTAPRPSSERAEQQTFRTPNKRETANGSPLSRHDKPAKTEPRSKSPHRETKEVRARPPVTQRSYKSKISRFFDDLDEPQITQENDIKTEARESPARKRPLSETLRTKSGNDEEKPRKFHLNEVPTFLM